MTIILSIVWYPRPRFTPLARSFSIKSWSSVIDVVRERRTIFPEPDRLMSSPRSRRSNSFTWASTRVRSVFLVTGFFIERSLLWTHGATAAVDRLDDAAGEIEVAADER